MEREGGPEGPLSQRDGTRERYRQRRGSARMVGAAAKGASSSGLADGLSRGGTSGTDFFPARREAPVSCLKGQKPDRFHHQGMNLVPHEGVLPFRL